MEVKNQRDGIVASGEAMVEFPQGKAANTHLSGWRYLHSVAAAPEPRWTLNLRAHMGWRPC